MKAAADGNRVLVFDDSDGNWHVIAIFNHHLGFRLSPAQQAQDYANFLNRQ